MQAGSKHTAAVCESRHSDGAIWSQEAAACLHCFRSLSLLSWQMHVADEPQNEARMSVFLWGSDHLVIRAMKHISGRLLRMLLVRNVECREFSQARGFCPVCCFLPHSGSVGWGTNAAVPSRQCRLSSRTARRLSCLLPLACNFSL